LQNAKNVLHSKKQQKWHKVERTITVLNINHCEVCGKSVDKSQGWVHDKECDLWYHASCYTEYTQALKKAVKHLENIE
jgi:hypothetical protein